jgi:hypothetical protein
VRLLQGLIPRRILKFESSTLASYADTVARIPIPECRICIPNKYIFGEAVAKSFLSCRLPGSDSRWFAYSPLTQDSEAVARSYLPRRIPGFEI